MPYGITHASWDNPAVTLAAPEGCKAELTFVDVISQDSLPAGDGYLS